MFSSYIDETKKGITEWIIHLWVSPSFSQIKIRCWLVKSPNLIEDLWSRKKIYYHWRHSINCYSLFPNFFNGFKCSKCDRPTQINGVTKWKLHYITYCHILVCFESSHMQTFTWQCTSIHDDLFVLGCLPLALNWIFLKPECISPQKSPTKHRIDFSRWTPSVQHIKDIASLLKSFSIIIIRLLLVDQFDTFDFPYVNFVRAL